MIRLDPRLRCALELLKGADTVADIGCDHGKLTAALLLEGGCRRVIAGDVSADCLSKARALIEEHGLQDRAHVRLGSGLAVLSPGECDAAALLGMGGELIRDLLSASPEVVRRLDRLVLQPMSSVEELRQWLYENRFHVTADRLVAVGQRVYQLLCVKQAARRDLWPQGFPQGCYLVGYRAFADREAMLGPYCARQAEKRRRLLAQAAGTGGEERLTREAKQLEEIKKEIEAWS